MAELLPRFRWTLEHLEDERRLAKILIETGGSVEDAEASQRGLSASADGHNWQRRRGLPLIGKGISGAMRGTDPLGALIAKENPRHR